MHFTTTAIALLSVATFTAAAPSTPAPVSMEKRDCLVNAANTGVWHEAGLSRYRTAFSCDPANLCEQYCDRFKSFASQYGGSNIQCWNDGNIGWTVDSSWVLGPAGDSAYDTTLGESRQQWIAANSCRTG